MAHTDSLPLGLAQYAPGYVPRANGQVYIAPAYVPDFGIVPDAVVPGSGPMVNGFYNPALSYTNLAPSVLLTPNMQANPYLGYIPGIMRMPVGSA